MNKYYNLILEKLNTWLELFVKHIPNITISIIILIVFYFISILAAKITNRILSRVVKSQAVINIEIAILKVVILGLGFVFALGVLGLQDAVFSLLAGVGIVGLALGFAFQDLATNLISGIFMAFRHPFGKGDLIETNDYIGKVTKLNLRNTIIENFYGQLIIIPNKEVFQSPLINYSTQNYRRVKIEVGVAYDSDLETVTKLIEDTLKKLDFCSNDKKIVAWVEEFGGSSINFDIRFWIKNSEDVIYPEARSLAMKALKKAFDENGIEIPFPIRTLDFGMAEKQSINIQMENPKN